MNNDESDSATGPHAESIAGPPQRARPRGKMTPEQLQERLVRFGVTVCAGSRGESRDFATSHAVQQVIRSATAVGANYAEARSASTLREFRHKLETCLRELRETDAWLRTHRLYTTPDAPPGPLELECDELIAILVSSLKTIHRRGTLK